MNHTMRRSCLALRVPSTSLTSLSSFADSFVIWVLNKGGPKPAIVTTASLLLVGNWLRYAGTKANGGIFGLAMFGQIIIGLAQPFCLCAPTRYSDLWFSDKGRTSATALASLANPLGAAIGQFVDSEWTTKPSDIPNMVLYISIIVRRDSPSLIVNPKEDEYKDHRRRRECTNNGPLTTSHPSHPSQLSSSPPNHQHPQAPHQPSTAHH